MKIFSGSSNEALAERIAANLGLKLVDRELRRFPDGEVFVQINEKIRGEEIFIIQSTSYPVAENYMELFICLDALKRASAYKINVVLPYFGFSRQDRKTAPRTPISASLIAKLLTSAGANSLITLDLHSNQIGGFFDIQVDIAQCGDLFVDDIRNRFDLADTVIVSPDVGGIVRARNIAEKLGLDLVIVDKRRPEASLSEIVNVIGKPKNKNCIFIDDIVDSGGTLCNGANFLLEREAKSVHVYVTHGVLSGSAVSKIEKSGISSLAITDTIDNSDKNLTEKFRIISVAETLAEVIKRIYNCDSVSSLFE